MRPETADPWNDPYGLLGAVTVLLMRPKPPAATLYDGLPKFGWFIRFIAVAPTVNAIFSLIANRLESCASISA